ncbi:bifunctional DNA-formamidopyrimidine glycosylase/DNA-(apurinic or apyrimidinic site) lyase [Hydrogenophaga sp. 5NK40-0174]|uniref:bifunctional DNA-formamidopyrimidine glycosylase/DNA-(apurinic or apyrimidinic site) lyase n=1 Tax=Hydrogenophaga sp. 5NK40-0174 TaxID=3127649 RepID=UPI00310B3393
MPELPEVEVTRRGIEPTLKGARIVSFEMGKPLRWPLGIAPARLISRTIEHVGRRGKFLVLELDEGILLIHLGMSGSLEVGTQLPPRGIHDHLEVRTTAGMLRLHDPRRFGAVVYADSLEAAEAVKLLGGLGVEPLTPAFAAGSFHAALRQRRAPIKQVLLAGDIVVGVGNIYASEALFMAGIRPTVAANRISGPRAARLHQAIVTVLERAVRAGGSTLRDFKASDGQLGYFQLDAAVYGRDGQLCRVCGTTIRHIRQGQRSTFYCPQCQKH